MSKFNLQQELLFRTIKIIDIGYIALLYFIIAYFLGYYLDLLFVYLYGTKYDTKSEIILILEILSQVIVIGIILYIGRNIVELIPFPLDGINGFEHQRVKELKNAGLFTVYLITFQFHLQDKIMFVKKKQWATVRDLVDVKKSDGSLTNSHVNSFDNAEHVN